MNLSIWIFSCSSHVLFCICWEQYSSDRFLILYVDISVELRDLIDRIKRSEKKDFLNVLFLLTKCIYFLVFIDQVHLHQSIK